MCTVTYLPKADGCLITSSRDESVFRGSAYPPAVEHLNGLTLLFPKDPKSNGTWIGTNGKRAVCLYNGAFLSHQKKPSYRMSRGLVPVSCLGANSVESFIQSFDPQGIEPFSIVVFEQGRLMELKWDEKDLHTIEHDATKPYIWASVTLYSKEYRDKRNLWFQKWIAKQISFEQDEILKFHLQNPDDDLENGLLIKRQNGLQTVSVTSMQILNQGKQCMTHVDLINSSSFKASL